MRWSVLAVVSLLGCATAVEPFSPPLDAGSESSTDTLATEDTEVSEASTDTKVPPVDAGPCKLVINEVQTGDGTSGNADFVELYNGCAAAASIGGHKLVYRSASGTTDIVLFTFAAGATVPAKGFRVIAGVAFGGSSDGALASGLAGGGASVALKDESDAVIDSIGYGTGTGVFVEGSAAAAPGDSSPAKSLSRQPDGADTDDNANDFKVGTPSPGAANAP